MVLSFVYFASILSIAINRPRKKRAERVDEQTGMLKKDIVKKNPFYQGYCNEPRS